MKFTIAGCIENANRALLAYENGGYEEATVGNLLDDLLTDLLHKYGPEEFDAAVAYARFQYAVDSQKTNT